MVHMKINDLTIVRNLGVHRTFWTVEISTKFTRKQAQKFYSYIENYMYQLPSKQLNRESEK